LTNLVKNKYEIKIILNTFIYYLINNNSLDIINSLVLKCQCHFPLKYFVIKVCQYFEQVQLLRDLEILKQHKYKVLAEILYYFQISEIISLPIFV